jgi:hypothetical protein
LGDQVHFGSINFRPHPPALLLDFGEFSRGVDLAVGGFDFHVGTQGTSRRLKPICSDSTAEASTPTTATLASSSGSTSRERLTLMMRSNVGSAASLGDLVDLFDDVSYGENSNASSTRVLQHMKSKNIDDECDGDDNADSGIRKVDLYPDFCTSKIYLARHQVCMVDIARGEYGYVEEDLDAEEE